MTKSRLEAFSDGVFAIIITIMVLELKIPHGSTFNDLLQLLPVFLSYVLSFLFVGIYWGNHHHLLHTVHFVNSKIIWANMHLLFWLSLIPFATGWMGENHFDELPVAVYGIVLLLSGFGFFILQKTIMAHYTHTTDLIDALKKQEKKNWISVILYLCSIPLAFVNSAIAALCFVIVAIMWIIPDRDIEKSLKDN